MVGAQSDESVRVTKLAENQKTIRWFRAGCMNCELLLRVRRTDGRTDGLDQFLLIVLTGLQNRLKSHQYRYGAASKPVEASVQYVLCLVRCAGSRLVVERGVLLSCADGRHALLHCPDGRHTISHLTGRRTKLGSVAGRHKSFVSTTS